MNCFPICRNFLFKCRFDQHIINNNYSKNFLLYEINIVSFHVKKVKYQYE